MTNSCPITPIYLYLLWNFNSDFIKSRNEGFDAVKEAVAEYTPEVVSRITGISTDDLRRAARRYSQCGNAFILFSMGITQHTHGTNNVMSITNMAMTTGKDPVAKTLALKVCTVQINPDINRVKEKAV